MEKDNKIFLLDMLDCIGKIDSYVNGYDYDQFVADSKTVDAVIRQVEVLGEAANNVPTDLRTEYSQIPWRKIIDKRNMLIHGYSSIQLSVIWDITQNDLDALELQIQRMLHDFRSK